MVRFTAILQGVAVLALSVLNFLIWYVIGREKSSSAGPCAAAVPKLPAVQQSPLAGSPLHWPFRIDLILSSQLMKYKENRLVNIRYPPWSLLVQQAALPSPLDCDRIVNPYLTSKRKYSCLAVMYAGTNVSYNLLRHVDSTPPKDRLRNNGGSGGKGGKAADQNDDRDAEPTNSTGFFGHVANDKGRMLQSQKMEALFHHLSDLERTILSTLAEKGLRPGDDLIVMVLNDGEMELYANFVCSLRRHGLVEEVMSRTLVFTSSADSLPLLRAMGSIAIHHEGAFPATSRHSSFEYLDPIFIEMMWYKSFSVWLMLKLNFNVLFMDVDIIFFRNPLAYFQAVDPQRQVDAFLSDDGQRSLRYAPFYANSGFYFLRANRNTLYFAWSIMTAFDLLHITGSHQNVYTLRLLESLDLYSLRTFFLPMHEFPSGVKFSHDRPYMRAIEDGHERPVIFHMCWTKNKEHKLVNFRQARMWYVQEEATSFFGRLGMVDDSLRGPERKTSRPPAYDEGNVWMDAVQEGEKSGANVLTRWESFAPLVCTDQGS